MIDHLNWESLEQRRQKARVIMLYNIIHNEVDINPQSYLKKQERTTRSAHPYQFQTYSPTTDYFKYSFFPQTVCIWNSLPNSMAVSGQSLDQFKTLIQGYKFKFPMIMYSVYTCCYFINLEFLILSVRAECIIITSDGTS